MVAAISTPISGEVAALSDAYPLGPHVTLRVAGPLDPPCSKCSAEAAFVVLEADVAVDPPHVGDFTSRLCYEWRRVLVGACTGCLPDAVRELSLAVGGS